MASLTPKAAGVSDTLFELQDDSAPSNQARKRGQILNPRKAPSLYPPIKWHGGKYYLAQKILSLAPPHLHYVEAFAGGLQVLLAKDPQNVSEIVNDVNGDLTNFWRVLQDDADFARFHRIMQATPFSEFEFERRFAELQAPGDAVERAARFFVVCRQSLAGRMKSFTGVTKTRTRRGMNNETSAWLACVDGLPAVHERLRRVMIINRDAVQVVRKHDGPRTWFYLDPPYMSETRATADVYAFEMPNEKHVELLETLGELKGKFALSGYDHPLYAEAATRHGWRKYEFDLPNNSAAGDTKRRMVECVWTNV